MKSIFASADLKSRAGIISQLIVPLLGLDEASRFVVSSRQILFSIFDAEGIREVVLEAEFIVTAWNLVSLIAGEIAYGRLRTELCGVVDESGHHDGIVVLFDERTAMTVFTSTETLRVRIGGFQDSATVHDGCLMQLSRDAASMNVKFERSRDNRDRSRSSTAAVRAREGRARKAKARVRMTRSAAQSAALIAMPRIVIKLIGNISTTAISAASLLQGVLYRDSVPRLDNDGLPLPGAAQIGALAQRLKTGLGVNVLQASHALQSLGLTKRGADDRIEQELKAGLGLGVGYLLGIGRTNLAEWTGADSEEEVKRFSQVKYDHLQRRGHHMPMPDRASRIRAEVSSIKTLSMAYGRAATILKAFQKVITMSSDLACIEIRKAYEQREAAFSPGDLIAIAISADVNPLTLWPKHCEVRAAEFEVLRFIGRVQRGANAVLLRAHFGAVRNALAAARGECTLAQAVIAGTLVGLFDRIEIIDGLNFVDAHGDALMITRGTRSFAVGEAVARQDRCQTTEAIW
jgi:hypothetical protein